jgi:transposase
MENYSVEFRKRIVEAYRSGKSGTYAETARIFLVGEATVSRLLRKHRETGDLRPKPKGGNHPRKVDLDWLRKHLAAQPDARLVERVDAWASLSGVRVSVSTMWLAVQACGWTHKKRHSSRANATSRRSLPNE